MKVFGLILVIATVVIGHPQPQSYNYNPPSSSYGAPNTGSNNNYQGVSSAYGVPPSAPVIHKHVYVHVPPPDNEYPAARRPIPVAQAQKHYKIVFIKAPSPPAPPVPIIPPQPQNEEKTLVYVLVKKAEEQADIVIPTPVPTQPSKPEVYFIKYKTQKEETGPYPDRVGPPPPTEYGPPSSQYGAPH